MTLKELSQLYHLKRELKQEQERLSELESSSFLKAGGWTNMSGGGGARKDSVEESYVLSKEKIEKTIAKKIEMIASEQLRLETYIASIPDSLTRQIFTARFVDGLSWLMVARRIGGYNTEDSVKKICYRAIKKTEGD